MEASHHQPQERRKDGQQHAQPQQHQQPQHQQPRQEGPEQRDRRHEAQPSEEPPLPVLDPVHDEYEKLHRIGEGTYGVHPPHVHWGLA
jgi:hypothetical protein